MEELYQALYDQGKYTKTFEEFKAQFESEDNQQELYTALNNSGDYTKSYEEFGSQFFGKVKK